MDAALSELEAVGVTDTPGVLVADADYWHQIQMDQVVEHGIDVLIPPDAGNRKTPRPRWDGGLYGFMRRVLATNLGGDLPQTQGMIEPVFGNTKVQQLHRPLLTPRPLRGALRMDIHHGHPQPAEAAHPPDGHRSRLTEPLGSSGRPRRLARPGSGRHRLLSAAGHSTRGQPLKPATPGPQAPQRPLRDSHRAERQRSRRRRAVGRASPARWDQDHGHAMRLAGRSAAGMLIRLVFVDRIGARACPSESAIRQRPDSNDTRTKDRRPPRLVRIHEVESSTTWVYGRRRPARHLAGIMRLRAGFERLAIDVGQCASSSPRTGRFATW